VPMRNPSRVAFNRWAAMTDFLQAILALMPNSSCSKVLVKSSKFGFINLVLPKSISQVIEAFLLSQPVLVETLGYHRCGKKGNASSGISKLRLTILPRARKTAFASLCRQVFQR
jgi:hypothetical protein